MVIAFTHIWQVVVNIRADFAHIKHTIFASTVSYGAHQASRCPGHGAHIVLKHTLSAIVGPGKRIDTYQSCCGLNGFIAITDGIPGGQAARLHG